MVLFSMKSAYITPLLCETTIAMPGCLAGELYWHFVPYPIDWLFFVCVFTYETHSFIRHKTYSSIMCSWLLHEICNEWWTCCLLVFWTVHHSSQLAGLFLPIVDTDFPVFKCIASMLHTDLILIIIFSGWIFMLFIISS